MDFDPVMRPGSPVRGPQVRRLAAALGVIAAAAIARPVAAIEKASEQVSAFYGSFSHAIPIEVPGFRGLEPRIALGYSSEGRNGFVGVGWSLSGFSTIQRVNSGLGTPRFDGSDVYLLDGQEMVPCQGGSVSPSCTSGGNWSTKIESYLKIRFDSSTNKWTVWSKDGTRTVHSALLTVPANAVVAGGTLRWGVSQRIDTDGNIVDYSWTCPAADWECYPSQATYNNGYAVTVYKESRPDFVSRAGASVLGQTKYRLRSIIVSLGTSKIRGYKLLYQASPLTGRSLLTTVWKYGRDLVQDGSGLITGGTTQSPTVPDHSFTYQTDSLNNGRAFQDWASPPTPLKYTEPVTWANLVNVATAGDGSSLIKYAGGSNWNAGADSSRALASGTGYVQWIASNISSPDGKAAGLSNGNTDTSPNDIDYAFLEGPGNALKALQNGAVIGSWTRTNGDVLRIEVSGGKVQWKKNGNLLLESQSTPMYPLRVDTAIGGVNDMIQSVTLSGGLIYVNSWCQAVLMAGDFNGDGRTDQLCYTTTGGVGTSRVSLALPTQFANPTTWITNFSLTHVVIADFNNDGKSDLATHDPNDGTFRVALSNGTNAFQAPTVWGQALGAFEGGPTVSCVGSQAIVGSGDFNGDGVTDVYCKRPNWESSYQFVGISNGSSFNFYDNVFGNFSCGDPGEARVGALDFDGDGKDDWYCIAAGNSSMLQVYPSTGSRFQFPAHGGLSFFCTPEGYVLGDLNGDGRTDAACRNNGKVALSMGRSFLEVGEYGGWCAEQWSEAFGADVDGDGATEIVCNHAGDGANDIDVRKWVGAGQASALAPAQTWRANWCAGKVRAGDWNGDAKTDLYCTSTAAPTVAGTGGRKVDLASGIANGLGGSVQLTYTPSSAFINDNNPPIKHTVTGLMIADGRGWSATTEFAYSGGKIDRAERVFLGFRYAKKTLPCLSGESVCPYVETWFKQDMGSVGKPETVARRHGNGNILAMQSFTYATNGSTVPRTSLLTAQTNHSYDAIGCPQSPCAQEKQTTVTHQYDGYGNRTQSAFTGDPAQSLDDRSTAWLYAYNPASYIVGAPSEERHFDHGGTSVAATRYSYDGSAWGDAPSEGHVTRTERWLQNDTENENRWVPSTTTYTPAGSLEAQRDPTGVQTNIEYDPGHNIYPTKVWNPALPAEAETTGWDAVCGVPNTHTDANLQVTAFETDALCRRTLTSTPLDGFEATFYRDFGDPSMQRVVVETPPAVDDGGNLFSAQHFDGLGRPFMTVAKGPSPAQMIYTLTTYNARGSVASATAPYYLGDPSYATTYSYDALDRLTTLRHPDNRTVGRIYGLWAETTTDENGTPFTVRFDAYGRVVVEEQLLEGDPVQTNFAYDSLGRLTHITDALNNVWSWQFDTIGRLEQRTHPDTGAWTFVYDDAGRVTRQTDAKNQRVELMYDAAGEVASRRTYDQSGSLTGTVTYAYSEERDQFFNVSRLTSVTGPGSTALQNDYDARGRLVRQKRTLDGTEYSSQVTFDAGDRLRSMQYPDQEWIGPLDYDQAGRVKAIPNILTEVVWDASGRPTRQTNFNGTVTERVFSAQRGLLQRIRTTLGEAATIQDLQYGHKYNGIVESVASPFNDESWMYGYDDLYRLTAAGNVSTPTNSQSWSYDSIGRITSNSRVGTYGYPSPGSPRPHAPATAGAHAFTYDPNGNLVAGAGRSLTWNVDNLLVSANAVQFTYDADGERLKVTRGTSVSRYPFGDDYEITNGVVTKYIQVDGLGLVAKKVAGQGTYWLHTDAQGSVQAITALSGAEVQRRTYRPYGEKIADTTAHVESRGWIDQRQDEETGLTYLHARYYDAELGVFISSDPIGAEGGLNSYLYSSGDPINWSDRFGLDDDPNGPFHPDDGSTGGGLGGNRGPGGSFWGWLFMKVLSWMFGGSHTPPAPRPPTLPRPGPSTPAPTPAPPPPPIIEWVSVPGRPGRGGHPNGPGPGAGSVSPSGAPSTPAATNSWGIHTYDEVRFINGVDVTSMQCHGSIPAPDGIERPMCLSIGMVMPPGGPLTRLARVQKADSLVGHHVFPKAFRGQFQRAGIMIDRYLVRIMRSVHQRYVHAAGARGGRWNRSWSQFFEQNANPTSGQMWDHLLTMLNEIGLKGP